MKYITALILVSLFVILVACGDDEEGHARPVRSESAEWSVLVDGDLVEGDKMEITDTEENGIVLRLYQSSGAKAILFKFGTDNPKVKTYDINPSDFSAYYSFEEDKLGTYDDGELNIIKYDRDSLVANFEFGISQSSPTPEINLTEGFLKARLR